LGPDFPGNPGQEAVFSGIPMEADPLKGKISIQSPIGAALLGKKIGDVVTVKMPESKFTYKIIGIS